MRDLTITYPIGAWANQVPRQGPAAVPHAGPREGRGRVQTMRPRILKHRRVQTIWPLKILKLRATANKIHCYY